METSSLSLIGGILIVVMSLLQCGLPRRYALIPILVEALCLPLGNTFMLFGLHFSPMRVLILFATIRVLTRGEFRALHFTSIDRAVSLWGCALVALNTLQGAVAGQTLEYLQWNSGAAYNAMGLYFCSRCFVRDIDDISFVARVMSVLVIPVALLMLLESRTQENLFSVFGGVPLLTIARDGKIRAHGPFAHPILAGSFGATVLPLILVNWWTRPGHKQYAIIGSSMAFLIVFSSFSSGPMFALVAGVMALLFWRYRTHLRALRWAVVIALGLLDLVMTAPVWFLMARVPAFSGSNGYHRALLIDVFVRHFREWCLWGVSRDVSNTWAPDGSDMNDIANQYLWQGVTGGFLLLIAFVVVLVLCFKAIGRSTVAIRAARYNDRLIYWCLGCALFAHAVNFLSVSYWDQNIVNWYLLLAAISSLMGANGRSEKRALTEGVSSPSDVTAFTRLSHPEVLSPSM